MGKRNSTTKVLLALTVLFFVVTGAFAGKGPTSPPTQEALVRADALMGDKRWDEAAKVLDRALLEAPGDHNFHLKRGRCALGVMDLSGAGDHFERALGLAPEIEGEVAQSWMEAALQALSQQKLDRAVAMFAKAFYHDRELGPELGRVTIEAAQKVDGEDRRAGYMTRAVAWAGSEPVLEASIAHYSRTLGAPQKVHLDNPGWAEIARLRPGDEFFYLSQHPFQQRDAATIRIVPTAVTQLMKLTVDERDTKGEADTPIWVARHQLPTSAYIWLLPGGEK